MMIPETNYAIITGYENILYIFDVTLRKFVKTLDHSSDPKVKNVKQTISQTFQFKCQEPLVILTTNDKAITAWSFNKDTLEATYNGIIELSEYTKNEISIQVAKHPEEDILFFGSVAQEIIAVKVNKFEEGYYVNLLQAQFTPHIYYDIENIFFVWRTINGIKTPSLIVGSANCTYTITLDIDLEQNKITSPDIQSPYFAEIRFYYNWLENKQNTELIQLSGDYISVYNYQTKKIYFSLCNIIQFNIPIIQPIIFLVFYSDGLSNKFIYEEAGITLIVSYQYQNQYISKKAYLGDNIYYFYYKFSFPIYDAYGSFYQVKNHKESLVLKIRDNGTDYISLSDVMDQYDQVNQSKIQKFNLTVFDDDYQYQITEITIPQLQLNWNNLSQNIDTFYQDGFVWIIVGFPNKDNLYLGVNGLFYIIKASDSMEHYILATDDPNENSRNSAFAVSSLEDENNKEIYGIDEKGTIYVWDLTFNSFQFKDRYKFDQCLKSEIGDIFHFNKIKKFILVCNDFYPYSYDFANRSYQKLQRLTSIPLAVKAFSSLKIIAIGDRFSGESYIYKYNETSNEFDFLLKITSGSLTDIIMKYDILPDNKTLWIQYEYGYLFFNISECIENPALCTSCTQTSYFKNTNEYDSDGQYGYGEQNEPFTTSDSFFTTMIKAQLYKQFIGGVTNMKVDIYIDPQNEMSISKDLINFDFNSIITLTFKSVDDQNSATLTYNDQFIFKNYNQITFQNMIIKYLLNPGNNNKCGLSFSNIKNGIVINRIQQYPSSQSNVSCQIIEVIDSILDIQEYAISDEDFTNHQYIIHTINSNQVFINNFTLNNCKIGDQFSILSQGTNIEAIIKSLHITNNYCIQNLNSESLPTSLFTAGLFNADDIHINDNKFCNKNIFQTISTLQHVNQKFIFSNLEVTNNEFQVKTNFIIFSALYSILSSPSHELKVSKSTFKNNELKQQFDSDLSSSSFFYTKKIAKLTFEEIHLENHFDIQLGAIQFASNVNFNTFYCINDQTYLDSLPSRQSTGCVQLNEVNEIKFTTLRVDRKKSYDSPLIYVQNYQVEQASIIVEDGEFSNLVLSQSTMNSHATPIYISSSYQIALDLIDCHFFNNNLDSIQYTLTYSTTGLWVENYVGEVTIKDSSFKNCYSNSKYNFVYIQSKKLKLDTVTLEKSSFIMQDDTANADKKLFVQEGGMMNINVNQVDILNSKFDKSSASKGSFIYMQAFSSVLTVNIDDTSFTEGYSQIDGGAFYIDTKGSQLDFTCNKCNFINNYSMLPQSSIIAFKKYQKQSSNKLDSIKLIGGTIKNVQGVEDNYFIESQNTIMKLEGIQEILQEPFTSTSIPHSKYNSKENKQHSTLFNLINSQCDIINCKISNFKFKNKLSLFPLLINSQNSQVTLKDSKINDCDFITSAMHLQGGSLVFDNTQLNNINLYKQQRLLMAQNVLKEVEPALSALSLILVSSGSIKAINKSSFLNIDCSVSCNGGVFQIQNGSISLDDVQISNTKSLFGGAIYIAGLKGDSSINNLQVSQSISTNSGGAIYINQSNQDAFKLELTNSDFTQNSALGGKGGAIYLSTNTINSNSQIFQIKNTKITNNNAQIAGGIYSQGISPKIFEDSIIKDNIGSIYGKDQFAYPSQLLFASQQKFLDNYKANQKNGIIEVDNFRSGESLEHLSFKLLNDQNGQAEIINPQNAKEVKEFQVNVIVNPNTQNYTNYFIKGNTTVYFNTDTQLFSFNDLKVVGDPGTSVVIDFKSNQIQVLNKATNNYEQNYSFKIKVNFRNCEQGEELNTFNGLSECQICSAGYYSYNVKRCQECPDGATCKGGADVTIDYGYWRKTNQSGLVENCDNQKENCVGGSFGDNICYEGHIGALCEECDIYGEYWGNSYSKSSKYSCARCDKIKNNIWIVALMTIWTLISMTLAIKGDIEMLKAVAVQVALQKNIQRRSTIQASRVKSSTIIKQSRIVEIRQKALSKTNKNTNSNKQTNQLGQDKSGIYIKMLTNYIQIVGSIATFNLSIPSGIFEFPESVGQPLRQTMNSLDCALQQLDTNIPIIYLRLIFSNMIPLIYVVLFLIGVIVVFFVTKEKQFPSFKIYTSMMFLIIYVQPDLVAQIIALISCRKIGDTEYILSNVSFECYTDEHLKYAVFLIIPLLLLWVFILPAILFIMLRKNRDKLDTIQVKLKYGFLYKEYQHYAFYWEFVKMVEKIAIILSLNFYSQSIITKAILVFIVITIYGILSLIIEPYQESDINEIDVNSTNVCAITVLLGLFMFKNPFPYFVYTSLGLIVLINLWFIIKIVQKIIGSYMPKIQPIITSIATKLSNKIPCFKKFLSNDDNKKKINPKIKERMRKVFRKYLEMNAQQKKEFFIKTIQAQLATNYKHIFVDEEEVLIFSENKLLIEQDQQDKQVKQEKQISQIQESNKLPIEQDLQDIEVQIEKQISLNQEVTPNGSV